MKRFGASVVVLNVDLSQFHHSTSHSPDATRNQLAFHKPVSGQLRIADIHVSQSQEESARSLGTLARACV